MRIIPEKWLVVMAGLADIKRSIDVYPSARFFTVSTCRGTRGSLFASVVGSLRQNGQIDVARHERKVRIDVCPRLVIVHANELVPFDALHFLVNDAGEFSAPFLRSASTIWVRYDLALATRPASTTA